MTTVAPVVVPRCTSCPAPSQWLCTSGRYCDACRPGFDPAHAVHLAVTGRLVDALRYCRSPHETAPLTQENPT